MSWTVNLANSQLNGMVSSAIADGSYSYQEILNLLDTVAVGGVTATEWADLKTVYSQSQALFASDYVETITYNVVYGNLANQSWWGGAKTYGGVVPLGNLSGTTSQTNAERLIDKWFLGLDLPMPIAGGDTATGKAATGVYTYAVANGTLFVNGATAADVNQGATGDCYYVATLGAVANASPTVISNAIIDNGNGSYGVKFYLNGVAAYTTVNKSLPTYSNGTVAFASNTTNNLNGEMWVSLLEKAFVQVNMQADIDNKGADWTGENSYQAIEGGWASPIKQLTNQNYKYYSSYYTGVPDALASGEYYSASAQTYKQTIINALNSGSIGWLGSFGESTSATNGKTNFVSGHAFMLLGYNAATDKFIVRNPWGGDGTDDFNPQFEASITEFWNSSVKGIVAISDVASSTPVYSYAVTTTASSAGAAVTEGAGVTFTVTRSASGTASTVYVSTLAASASATDYQSLSKYALSFSAYETSKTVTVMTNVDSLSEGSESFGLAVYQSATDTASVATATAYIKDAATTSFNYTLASSAGTAASAVSEGGTVTFTVTRSGSGAASTVYLSTATGTASTSDYQGLSKYALNFASYETSKTVSVSSIQDATTEGTEYFSLDLFKNLGDTTRSGTALGYVKDVYLPSYNYTITSNAASPATAVVEGNKVTFTVTRSGSGTASTVYLSTVDGSAGAADYVGFSRQAVTFAANEKIATLQVEVNEDWWLETDEFFTLQLFKNVGDTAYASAGSAYIKDKPVASYNYTITSNATTSAPVTEGSPVTFTITRSGTGLASSVFLSTGQGSAGGSDFQGLSKSELSFAAYETSKTVTVDTYTDGLVEGNEYFWLQLYRNMADSSYATYASGYIKDPVVATNYSYTVSSSAQNTPVTEGANVTFTITRSGSGTASTVYWDTEAGTASSASGDYQNPGISALNFASYETSKTVTVATYADAQVEGDEYFWLNIYKTYADATNFNWSSYGVANIQDPAVVVTNYNYTVTSNAEFGAPVSEGGAVTFTVTRSGSGSASSVYVSTSDGNASTGDFQVLNAQVLTFSAFETSKTVTVNTYADALTEGSEYFWLDVYKSYADVNNAQWSSYGIAYIKDPAVVVTNYNYSISSSTSSAPVTEGGTVTFTVTRAGSGSASVVYLSTYAGTAGVTDYQGLDKVALNFSANETSKTVTVNTYTDSLVEGNEYFYLELFKTYADANNDAWDQYGIATIKDPVITTNFDYAVTSNANPTAVTEGGTVSFTITRSGSGVASTVYWGTEAGTASVADGDYESLGISTLNFAANEVSKTVTVKTYTDSKTEGEEYFWLNVYKTYADATNFNWSSYGSAYLTDPAVVVNNYTYTISSSANSIAPVTEGGAVTFTITRSGAGAASTVYLSTYTGTADWSDYQGLTASALSFSASETVKTVTVNTYVDSSVEGSEYFFLELFNSYADAIAYNWASYGTGYIKDPVVVTTNYNYTVTSNAQDVAVTEGGTVTFTVTRSATGSASTVYVRTSDGSTSANDFQAMGLTALTFAANETSKTVTVKTYVDTQLEYIEVFWLDLFKTSADAAANNWDTYGLAYIGDPGLTSMGMGSPLESPAPSAGRSLGASATVSLSKSMPGRSLTESNNDFGFAALRSDGSVVAWGDAVNGGDLGGAAAALDGTVDVTHIYTSSSAFAALRADGAVITWGNADAGGDSSAVAVALNGVVPCEKLFSTESAFAALRADGSVVTWGNAANGGDSSSVSPAINGDNDVIGVYSNMSSFAAIRADGSVVSWGFDLFGGDSSAVASKLSGGVDVTQIVATGSAFAALRSDGSLVTWGNAMDGGDSSAVASKINGGIAVSALSATASAFAALRTDGSVVTWGDVNNGGDSSAVSVRLNGTVDATAIVSTQSAFAAQLVGGAVVTWGSIDGGGDSSAVTQALNGDTDVVAIYANDSAFAALRSDGSVVSWGYGAYGGDQSAVAKELDGTIDVLTVIANDHAFAALRADGSVVTWGSLVEGGDSSAVQSKLDGSVDVSQVYATSTAFAALRKDGAVVTWGNNDKGGDSSKVTSYLSSVKNLTGDLSNAWLDTIAPTLTGSDGNDSLTSTVASETIDGGLGSDTVVLSGTVANYSISISRNRDLHSAIVTDLRANGDGVDSLKSIEKLQFADKTFELENLPRTETPAFGKTPSFLFDASYYLLTNPELVPSVNLNTAYSHYISAGAAQGKDPNDWFDPVYYANKWPDLKPLNLDAATLFMHYNLYGVWEGRSAGPDFESYDGSRYLADNPDVAAYVDQYVADFLGSRSNGAIAHYVIYGGNEGRLAYDTSGNALETVILIGPPVG